MAAGNYDIVIDQGSDFALEFTLSEDGTAIPISTHTVTAQLRPTPFFQYSYSNIYLCNY